MAQPRAQHSTVSMAGQPLSAVLVGLVILLMFGGYLVLRSGRATVAGNEPSVPRAIFAVVNAGTLTGFQQSVNVKDYKPLGQAVVFVLIVSATLMSLIVGGCALARILNMPYTDRHVVQASCVTWLLAVLIGATVVQPEAGLWGGIFQAASAFGNAGHVVGPLPPWDGLKLHLVLLPLGLVGGIGVVVVLDLFASFVAGRALHPHTRAVLAMTAGIYLLAVLAMTLAEWRTSEEPMTMGEWIDYGYAREAFVTASTEAMNNRTLGLPLDTFRTVSRPSQWIVLVLMLIGASPAGTGGGLKTTTLLALALNSVRLIRGEVVGRAFGLACLWLIAYLGMAFLLTLLLLTQQLQAPIDRLFFLVVSAMGNVGTSHSPLTLTGTSLYILSAAMLFGRFAPLALLWWAATHLGPQEAALPLPRR